MTKIIASLICLFTALASLSCVLISCEKSDNINDDNSANTANTTVTSDNENNLEETLKDDNITPQPSENDIAMQMYEAAIDDDICVIDWQFGEIKLKDCRFSSENTRIEECKLLTKAILDLDGDGINEYVIKSPDNDHIVLHYYDGKVYSYCLDTIDFYNFNTDGTFYCYDSYEDGKWECGLSQIIFDGQTLNIKSIYSLKHSTNPTTYEYYVGRDVVTTDEYYDYRNQNISKDKIKFSQFELSNSYPITAQQAWELANAYWDNQDGSTECAAGTVWIAKIVLIDTPTADTNYYRVAFQVESCVGGGQEGYECMPPHSIDEKDQILVNAFTGEITTPAYESGKKCISIDEAIEIAKNGCEQIDFDKEENKYRVELDADVPAPDHIYVIVIQKLVDDHYVFYTREWVDKYTGEIVFSYYVYGKG